jgi:hypothetical protein
MQRSVLIWGMVMFAAFGLIALGAPEALGAAIIIGLFSGILIWIFRHYARDPGFITRVFFAGLAARLLFGILIYAFSAQEFFGGDALTFHYKGSLILDYWLGDLPSNSPELIRATTSAGPGWGIHYLVAAIYWVFGKNFLAAQSFAAVFGAATAPLVYFCSEKIFQNNRVARVTAIGVALFPAFVIWSGQLLKDGLIIFLLVLAMTMVLSLQEKFNYVVLILLILSLIGILTLRFYIFYMVAVAVAGSFVIGVSNSPASVARRAAVLVIMGVVLTYMGVIRTASVDLETYGDLDRLQVSRMGQATSADSGFAEDIDVSTTHGALSAIPIGFIYLLFAPFPWEVSNLRQAVTLPEVFLWWAMIPLMIWGIWYTIKHKLRSAFPILIFSAMLTLVYSIFQSNVGTAYRQRTQIQVFLFIFIAVGWVLYREKREDRKLVAQSRRHPVSREIDEGVQSVR